MHRADDSGTTDNFTDYLFQAAGDVWTSEPDGVWPLEGGEAANGTSGVVGVVESTVGAITYADASRAGDLGVVNVAVGDEFVAPTPESAAAVVENSPAVEGRGDYDFAIEVNRKTEGSGEYPVVLVSYHIGCIQYDDEETANNVRAFIEYVVSEDGQQTAAENAGNAPISESLREQAAGRDRGHHGRLTRCRTRWPGTCDRRPGPSQRPHLDPRIHERPPRSTGDRHEGPDRTTADAALCPTAG